MRHPIVYPTVHPWSGTAMGRSMEHPMEQPMECLHGVPWHTAYTTHQLSPMSGILFKARDNVAARRELTSGNGTTKRPEFAEGTDKPRGEGHLHPCERAVPAEAGPGSSPVKGAMRGCTSETDFSMALPWAFIAARHSTVTAQQLAMVLPWHCSDTVMTLLLP